jgi:hypothetical protein
MVIFPNYVSHISNIFAEVEYCKMLHVWSDYFIFLSRRAALSGMTSRIHLLRYASYWWCIGLFKSATHINGLPLDAKNNCSLANISAL